MDAWRVIEIQGKYLNGTHISNRSLILPFPSEGHGEFLLVFQTLAIYVDLQGRKSRDREIMYPAVPTHISMFFDFEKLCSEIQNCILQSYTFSLL